MAQTVPNKGIHDPRWRKAGYIVLVAALGVLTAFDVLTEDVAEQVESLIVQALGILGFSIAAANTPREEKPTKVVPAGG